MIPENREKAEKIVDKEKCIQALESWLRQETSYEAMSNEHVAAAVEQRLALKAKDWSLKYKMDMPDSEYALLAKEAVRRYLDNWKGKKQGEDDRGHRLGKSKYV